jgi:hypothetical protein
MTCGPADFIAGALSAQYRRKGRAEEVGLKEDAPEVRATPKSLAVRGETTWRPRCGGAGHPAHTRRASINA